MITAAQLGINVIANTLPAEAGLARLGAQANVTRGKLGALKMIGLALAVAVVGIGVATIKAAGNFQAGVTTLVTGAGEAQSNMKLVSDGILNLATATGESTKQLIAGAFMVESAGFHGAAALDVLKAAAEGARVGAADLGAVANGVTTIMVDYKDKNISAAMATNILIATVANGKTHMQDLATYISAVLPAASAVKANLLDVAGAMATMTGEGTDAANAATYLRQLLLALAAPAKNSQKALAAIGLSAAEVSAQMKVSLPGALKLIMQHLAETYKVGSPQYIAALKAIAGGARQMQGILELTGTHLKTFGDNVANITAAAKKGGNSITGWSLVQKDFNFQLDRAKEVVETLAIRLGTLLLPVATRIAAFVADTLGPSFGRFLGVLTPVQNMASSAADKLGWLSGALKRLAAPFDEGSRAAGKLYTVIHPLKNTFDESAAAAHRVVDVIKKVTPPFDEGSRAVARLGNTVHGAHAAVNPILTILHQLGDIISADVVPIVVSLAGFIVKDVVPAAMQFAGWFSKNVMPVLANLANVIKTDVVPTVENIASVILKKVLPPAEQLGQRILPQVSTAFNIIGWVLKNVVGPVLNVTINIIGFLITAVTKILDVVNFVVDGIRTGIMQIPGFFQGAFGALWGIVKQPINLIIGGINSLISGLDNIHFQLPSWVPGVGGKGFGINIPLIPMLAKGGPLDAGQVGIVGERGPEMIIPRRASNVVSNLQIRQALSQSSVAGSMGGSLRANNAGAGAQGPTTVVVQVDQYQLMRIILPAIAKSARTQAAVRHM